MQHPLMRRLAALLLCVTLAWSSPAAAIDPVMLFVLRMLRDRIITQLADAAVEAALKPRDPQAPAPLPAARPGIPPPGMPEPERIRFLIEHNFTYLSAPEQDRVYHGLMAALDNPANAAARGRMLDEFWQMAIAVGEAQRILERLSHAQKQEIASSAGAAFRELPPEQRQETLALLRTSQAPIPQDLNAMLLREFER